MPKKSFKFRNGYCSNKTGVMTWSANFNRHIRPMAEIVVPKSGTNSNCGPLGWIQTIHRPSVGLGLVLSRGVRILFAHFAQGLPQEVAGVIGAFNALLQVIPVGHGLADDAIIVAQEGIHQLI